MEKIKELLAKLQDLNAGQLTILCLVINAVGSLCNCLGWGILTEIFLILGIGCIVYAWIADAGNITVTAVLAVLIWLVPAILTKGFMGALLSILYICLDLVLVMVIILAVKKWLLPDTYLDWETGEKYELKGSMLVSVTNENVKIGPVNPVYVGSAVFTVNGVEKKGGKYTTAYGDFFKETGFLDFGPARLS